MILVLILVAVLWWGGGALGLSRRLRIRLVALVYIAILLNLAVLPEGRRVLDGSAGEWLVVGGLGALALAYGQGLRRLKARAEVPEVAPPAEEGPFTADELQRYSRHIMLREIGGPGQRRLKDARVLIIGAGGLGAPALQYLAASGVGLIGIVDDDVVELSNLQRQVIHATGAVGEPKVASAARALQEINPHVALKTYSLRFSPEVAAELLSDYDLILEGSDNFETRYAANAACVAGGKPMVSGALSQWEGQISVFDPARGTPCYRCIFPEAPAPGLAPSCAEAGVLSPLPGVIGTMMAVEAVKLITGAGEPLLGRMLIYDALYGETRIIVLKKRADCADCGSGGSAGQHIG